MGQTLPYVQEMVIVASVEGIQDVVMVTGVRVGKAFVLATASQASLAPLAILAQSAESLLHIPYLTTQHPTLPYPQTLQALKLPYTPTLHITL